ncbi:MAG: serine hydrolase [Alphaproteobacteria bacterium]|nr:serine hydrolase [Alphaproteobacteria bacterium]
MSVNVASVQTALDKAAASGALAGAVAMCADRGGVIFEGAAGRRSVAADAPMTSDTTFWIASMTKALTSTAAAMLAERGALDLDAPAKHYIPAIGDIGVLTGFDANGRPITRAPRRPVTARALLTHSAGFGYELFSADVEKSISALGLPPMLEGKRATLTAPLIFDPGERWEYGVNTDWAGLLVEAVSGKTLGQFLSENIFLPLGMSSTAFAPNDDMRARQAGMHVRLPDGALAPMPFEMSPVADYESGGGGLYSTAGDYLTFLQMILHGGKCSGNRLLSAETVTALSTNQMGDLRVRPIPSNTPMSRDSEFFPGMEKSWSLAFMINHERAPTGRAAGSLAWAGLANSFYWIDPATGVCGVFLAQLVPFADDRAIAAYLDFETAVYDALGRA